MQPGDGGGRPGQATILVVEDNGDGRDALVSLLELGGHRVFGAATGVHGLEMALRLRPEVVITDLMLPDLDGLDLTRQLRERANGYQPVVIAFSGAHREAGRAKDAGCDGFVLKPDINALLEMLTEASLDALRQRRKAASGLPPCIAPSARRA